MDLEERLDDMKETFDRMLSHKKALPFLAGALAFTTMADAYTTIECLKFPDVEENNLIANYLMENLGTYKGLATALLVTHIPLILMGKNNLGRNYILGALSLGHIVGSVNNSLLYLLIS